MRSGVFSSRFKIDVNLIAILTTILSVAAVAFFNNERGQRRRRAVVLECALPGVTLSLVQIFLLIALLIAVFWISSRTKRFLFNRFLAKSGLDRSLQYAIAQMSATSSSSSESLSFSIMPAFTSGLLTVFCWRGWRRRWLWSAKHREQFYQRPRYFG